MADAEFSFRTEGAVGVLGIKGSLDAHSTPQFDKEIKGFLGKTKKIIIDMTGVDYIATAGLGVLIASFNDAKSAGGNIIISGMSEKIRHVFETMGFTKVLTIADSVSKALTLLK
jgi:anti-sigma B factor antagonist